MPTRSFLDTRSSGLGAELRRRHTGLAIRETTCKTILNRSKIEDYSLNCYTGCGHGCVYCYARFMQRFHPHPEPWGKFVDVKVNAVETLKRQLRRAKPGNVFVSSACDGWQQIEKELGLTRRCCELLLERGFGLYVLTKSPLVLRDLDIFEGRPVTLGVTLTTLDERLGRLWEPKAGTVRDRQKVLSQARAAGIKTSVMFGPLLPGLSDTQQAIDELFRCAADLKVDAIYVDALNPRPRVWPSVSAFLARRFPELVAVYRQILFDPHHRRAYLRQLGRRVQTAARRFRLSRRLRSCF